MAYGDETQRRRLHGHTIRCVPTRVPNCLQPPTPDFSSTVEACYRNLLSYSFPHAPQRLSTVTQRYLLDMPHGALDKEAFKTQLAAMAGVDAAAVRVPETVAAEGGSSVEVCIGPLSTAFADAVGDKLRACTACVADAGRALGVTVRHADEPCTASHAWSFGEAVLRAALESVTVQFVGPEQGKNSKLEKFALQLFAEDGDLQLRYCAPEPPYVHDGTSPSEPVPRSTCDALRLLRRPHVIFNELTVWRSPSLSPASSALASTALPPTLTPTALTRTSVEEWTTWRGAASGVLNL